MANVLIDVPDTILSRVDTEVTRLRATSIAARFAPIPPGPRPLKKLVTSLDEKGRNLGHDVLKRRIDAAQQEFVASYKAWEAKREAYVAEKNAWLEGRRAQREAGLDARLSANRPSRVGLLREILALGFAAWEKRNPAAPPKRSAAKAKPKPRPASKKETAPTALAT